MKIDENIVAGERRADDLTAIALYAASLLMTRVQVVGLPFELFEGKVLSVFAGALSADDTIGWIIGNTVSGAIGGERLRILVKPTKPNFSTNSMNTTSKRTYYLEIYS